MDINQIRAEIETSYSACATPDCGEMIDGWFEVDPSEPGHTIMFVPMLKRFAGMCSKGHANEITLDQAREGDFTFLDVTMRTMKRYVSQEDCTHGKRRSFEIPADGSVITMGGIAHGPAKIIFCDFCAGRWKYEGPRVIAPKPPKIILP